MKNRPLLIAGIILTVVSVILLNVFNGLTAVELGAYAGVIVGAALATVDIAKKSKYGVKSFKTWAPILLFIAGVICSTVGGIGEKTIVTLIGAVIAVIGIIMEILLSIDNKK